MANEMIEQNQALIPDYGEAQFYSDDTFDKIATASGFLPRLQLFGGNSEAVKEGKIGVAKFGLVRAKDQIENLGDQVDVIPISIRFVAMRLEEGNVVSVYNPENPDFKQIMTDSEEPNSRCMYGPQFLVYIPSIKTFATFLFGSKTARKEGRNMKALLRRGATLKSKYIKTKQFSWHSPIVLQCQMPLDAPNPDMTLEIVNKFNNPEEKSVEKAEDTPAEGNGEAARVR